MQAFLEEAKRSSRTIANLSTAVKNKVLNEMADALMNHCDFIISHNEKDMMDARVNNLSESLQDRLLLTGQRVKDMADAIRQIASQLEPVGRILDGWDTRWKSKYSPNKTSYRDSGQNSREFDKKEFFKIRKEYGI